MLVRNAIAVAPSLVVPPTPYVQATQDALIRAEQGPAETTTLTNDLLATGNFAPTFAYVDESILYWQAIQLDDPGNGDTLGTLGYFAVSARDFWSEFGDLIDDNAPPHVILDQLDIWHDYTTATAGQPIPPRQPIDKWFEENP